MPVTSLLKYIVARSHAFKKRDLRPACFYCISLIPFPYKDVLHEEGWKSKIGDVPREGEDGEDVSAFSPRLISRSLSSTHGSPDDETTTYIIDFTILSNWTMMNIMCTFSLVVYVPDGTKVQARH